MGATEILLGYVGAAASKSMLIGLIILATSAFFVPLSILHPVWMVVFLALTALTFSLFGFVLGIWATSWEKLQFVPALIITPLTFLGGSFYSIDMLPAVWRTITLFNPVVYLISGFRWSFYGQGDVDIAISFTIILGILAACLALAAWMIRTGWRMRNWRKTNEGKSWPGSTRCLSQARSIVVKHWGWHWPPASSRQPAAAAPVRPMRRRAARSWWPMVCSSAKGQWPCAMVR